MQIERFFSSKLVAVVAYFCYRRLPKLFSMALRYSGRVFNRKCKLSSEQHGIERGSAHQQASECLRPRGHATGRRNSQRPSGKIPVGCETASSKLAHRADLSARRCIT